MISAFDKKLKRVFFTKNKDYKPLSIFPTTWELYSIDTGTALLKAALKKANVSERKLVILCAPYTTLSKDFFLESGHPDMYHDWNFDVVIFDLNGFGESSDNGFHFSNDVIAVASYFKSLLNAEYVIGHGISFGGAVLIETLTLNHPFQSAILENVLDETPSYFKVRNRRLYILMKMLMTLMPGFRNRNQYYKTINRLRDMNKILLIYNNMDTLTTTVMGHKLRDGSNIEAELIELKGTHLSAIETDPENYRSAIKKYLAENHTLSQTAR